MWTVTGRTWSVEGDSGTLDILKVIERLSERQRGIGLREFDKVTVIGVGGVGFYVAVLLSATHSVGGIRLVDFDTVEPENYNRLPFIARGRYKVEACQAMIKVYNPFVYVDPMPVKAPTVSLSGIIGDAHIVFECTDHIPTQEAVFEFCKERNIPYIGAHYNGVDHVTIDVNRLSGSWSVSDESGYVSGKSWVAPAVLTASLAVYEAMMGDLTPKTIRLNLNTYTLTIEK